MYPRKISIAPSASHYQYGSKYQDDFYNSFLHDHFYYSAEDDVADSGEVCFFSSPSFNDFDSLSLALLWFVLPFALPLAFTSLSEFLPDVFFDDVSGLFSTFLYVTI